MFSNLKNCPSRDLPNCIAELELYARYAYKLIGSRWMSSIIFNLSRNRILRFGELGKILPPDITHKMLSQQLKALEEKELIQRTDYHEKAPRVEYSLTEKGISIMPLISAIVKKYEGKIDDCKSLHSKDCALENALKVISGKWKTSILIFLWLNSSSRYTQIKSVLPNVTNTYLSAQLKVLESNGLILRTGYLEIPPRVEYSLTQKGLEIISLIDLIISNTKEILLDSSNTLSLTD